MTQNRHWKPANAIKFLQKGQQKKEKELLKAILWSDVSTLYLVLQSFVWERSFEFGQAKSLYKNIDATLI